VKKQHQESKKTREGHTGAVKGGRGEAEEQINGKRVGGMN